MSEIAIWIELMYAACKTDWVAAQLTLALTLQPKLKPLPET